MVNDVPLAALAVDLVILTIRGDALNVMVIRRLLAPYEGSLALPGGFVLEQEDLAEAALRELGEETGLSDPRVHLEQLGTYGRPDRDPRGRVVSVAYLALAPDLPSPIPGSDAATAAWTPIDDVVAQRGALAFDHGQILADGVERARAKLEYTALAATFCPDEFTIAELRRVYEAVWGVALDARNFHRKVTNTADFVVPTGRRTTRDGGRPAQLYRVGGATALHPPLANPGLG